VIIFLNVLHFLFFNFIFHKVPFVHKLLSPNNWTIAELSIVFNLRLMLFKPDLSQNQRFDIVNFWIKKLINFFVILILLFYFIRDLFYKLAWSFLNKVTEISDSWRTPLLPFFLWNFWIFLKFFIFESIHHYF